MFEQLPFVLSPSPRLIGYDLRSGRGGLFLRGMFDISRLGRLRLDDDLEGFQCRETTRLARFAGRDQSDSATVGERGGTRAVKRLCRFVLCHPLYQS